MNKKERELLEENLKNELHEIILRMDNRGDDRINIGYDNCNQYITKNDLISAKMMGILNQALIVSCDNCNLNKSIHLSEILERIQNNNY